MTVTRHHMTSQQAPCGKLVEAESYEDRDDEALLTREIDYACGCVFVVHEYHDGCVACKVTHHNGTVLKEELLTAE